MKWFVGFLLWCCLGALVVHSPICRASDWSSICHDSTTSLSLHKVFSGSLSLLEALAEGQKGWSEWTGRSWRPVGLPISKKKKGQWSATMLYCGQASLAINHQRLSQYHQAYFLFLRQTGFVKFLVVCCLSKLGTTWFANASIDSAVQTYASDLFQALAANQGDSRRVARQGPKIQCF